ncbi:alkaline phosphatase family protein, partial [candidate division KSB1 bacterium]|nr:alkaline phosphatase family protein [candidate division KSB1 bacterium]
MQKNRVLIIGLDGATFDFIKPLLNSGKLPNLNKIVLEGVYGNLESTLPPICAAGWASFLTGKNPGKHGVFDFFEFKKNAYKKQVIDINSIKTITLWEILERHHKKMIFMNVPIMYPPKPINGIMVSGALTPPGKKCAFPESLSRELYRDGYVVDVAYNYFSKLDQFNQSIKDASARRFEHFYHLLNKTNWDLAMIVFEGVERLQQAVWERPDLIEEQYIE